MQITLLKQKGKSDEYYIELDGEKKGTLQLETIYKHHLKEGKELDEQEFVQIKDESDRLTCFSKALAYISSRLKTEKQMKDYLLSKGYSYDVTKEALEKLKEYGYLNDEYYAKTFAEIAGKNKGKKYIKQQLYIKGVKSEVVDNLELNDDDDSCREVCQKWLKGKTLPLEQKDKEKLYRFLLSRGYEYETIRHTINVVANETDDDWLLH